MKGRFASQARHRHIEKDQVDCGGVFSEKVDPFHAIGGG
jgi:hypothetical protein